MDSLNLLLKVLLVTVGVGTVVIFVWILVGDSPTITDFLVMMVSGIVLYLVQLNFYRGKFEGKVITSFHYLKRDLAEMNNNLKDIQERVVRVEQTLGRRHHVPRP